MKNALFLFALFIQFSSSAMSSSDSLYYIVRPAKVHTPKPGLMILLHGVGSNEEDLFSFAEQLPENFYIVSARAPITIEKNAYAWYHVDFSTGKPKYDTAEEKESRKLIIQLIADLKNKLPIDSQKIYLCGFSQGAIMSYSIALTRPNLVSGIAAMSGRLLEEIKPNISQDSSLKKLNVYISHGTKDPVLKIEYAQQAYDYTKSLGLSPIYHNYPEGHTISEKMLMDLLDWMRKL